MFRAIQSLLRSKSRNKPCKTHFTLETLEARDVPAIVVPELSSNPGAPYTIYIDFDGMTVEEWGDYEPGIIPAFDLDNRPNDTSPEEFLVMGRAWAHVAEDFAPFNVNVTTIKPAGDRSPREDEGVRVIVGGSSNDWLGKPAFGVAYLNHFQEDGRPKAFVFSEDMEASGWSGPRLAKVIGDVVSHEAGHTMGLEHQSLYSYTIAGRKYYLVNEYHPGFQNVDTGQQYGVIMGSPYSTRSTWWNGTPSQGQEVGYLRKQDDMAILASVLGWRADESTRNLGAILPGGARPIMSGIIGTIDDKDSFNFYHPGGPISIDVTAFGEGSEGLPLAANLDAKVSVVALGTRGAMTVGSFEPTTSLGVHSSLVLPGIGSTHPSLGQFTGNYLMIVGSQGRYGDVGQYTAQLRYGYPPAPAPSVATATVGFASTAAPMSARSEGPIAATPVNPSHSQSPSSLTSILLPALLPKSNNIGALYSDPFAGNPRLNPGVLTKIGVVPEDPFTGNKWLGVYVG